MAGQNPDNLASAIFGVPSHTAELIVRYHDGDLSDAELSQLCDALKQSPQARALFVQWSLNFQMLRESLAPQYREDDGDRSADVPVLGVVPNTEQDYTGILAELVRMEASAVPDIVVLDKPRRPEHADPNQDEDQGADADQGADQGALSAGDMVAVGGYLLRRTATPKRLVYAGLAAAFVLAAALFALYQGGPDSAPAPAPTFVQPPVSVDRPGQMVATLTAQHDAQWAEAALAAGSSLHAGQRLDLTHGFAQITTARGAVVILEAPCTIKLTDNDNALRLVSGKLVGICETDGSKGLLVRTPHMDVTDLGTRFGVDASSVGASSVHIFEGEVEVARASGTATHFRERFVRGEAVHVVDGVDGFTRFVAEPARFASIPNTPRFLKESSALGLAVGASDPNWHVVALNGTPIVEPAAMLVIDRGDGGNRSEDRLASVPYHWLAIPEAVSPARAGGRTYTCRVMLQMPADFDREVSELLLVFDGGRAADAVRVNGRALELSADVRDRKTFFTPPFELALSTLVTAGSNTIEIDVYDTDKRTRIAAGLEIRPRDP